MQPSEKDFQLLVNVAWSWAEGQKMKHVESFFAIEIFQSETYDEVQSRKLFFSESKTIQTIQFNATLKINMEPKNHPIE